MRTLQTNRRPSNIGPRIGLLSKFNTQGTDLTQTLAPIANATAGELIYSGMLVSLRKDSGATEYGFTRGVAADSVDVPHFAYNDQSDADVIESGGLTAYPITETLEFTTAWFKKGVVYTLGAPLTYDAETGTVKLAATDDPVVGYVSGTADGPTNIAKFTSECDPVFTPGATEVVPGKLEVLVLQMRTAGTSGIVAA